MPEAPLRSWELELEKYKKFCVGHNDMRPKQLALLWNVKILQKRKIDFAITKSYCQHTTPEALLCSWKLELEKYKMLQRFESDMK